MGEYDRMSLLFHVSQDEYRKFQKLRENHDLEESEMFSRMLEKEENGE